MRKVFLSTLGTKKYVECIYKLNGKTSSPVNHIQEALIDFLCSDWNKDDLILILCTKEAEKNNWKDRKDFGQGLESRLKSLSIRPQVKMMLVPDGKSEDELTDIFNILLRELKPNDRLFLDLTHSTRLIPFLHTVFAVFSRTTRNVRIEGIYYGATEVVGTIERLRKLHINERVIPIFDITPFYRLLDLGIAIKSISSPDLSSMSSLEYSCQSINILNPKGEESFKHAMKNILDIYQTLIQARSRDLEKIQAHNYQDSDGIPFVESVVSTYKPLLQVKSGLARGFYASMWCLKRGLLPQALIFAIETALSELCKLENHAVDDFNFRKGVWNELLLCVASSKKNLVDKNYRFFKGLYIAKTAFKHTLFGKLNLTNKDSLLASLDAITKEAEDCFHYRKLSREQYELKERYGDGLVPIATAYAEAVELRDNIFSGGWMGNNCSLPLVEECKTRIENLFKALMNFIEEN